MLWLSKLFTGVGGSSLTIPVLIVGLLIMWHQRTEARDQRLTESGRQQCDATWLVASAQAQEQAARNDAERAKRLAEERVSMVENLTNELAQTRQKYAGYIPSDDPRCLSDGVLDALRRRQPVDRGR